jgi:hypothetical protein
MLKKAVCPPGTNSRPQGSCTHSPDRVLIRSCKRRSKQGRTPRTRRRGFPLHRTRLAPTPSHTRARRAPAVLLARSLVLRWKLLVRHQPSFAISSWRSVSSRPTSSSSETVRPCSWWSTSLTRTGGRWRRSALPPQLLSYRRCSGIRELRLVAHPWGYRSNTAARTARAEHPKTRLRACPAHSPWAGHDSQQFSPVPQARAIFIAWRQHRADLHARDCGRETDESAMPFCTPPPR